MVHLSLTTEEANLIKDILDWWTTDYDEATTDVINDRIHDTPEQLLEAVSGMHETFALSMSIVEKLNVSGATSSI